MLQLTVSRPVCLGVRHPYGAHDQIFFYCQTVAVLLMCVILSDKRIGVQFRCAAGPHQHSQFPQDSLPYITVSVWDSPNLVPIFISPRNRMAQLYPRALGWLAYQSQRKSYIMTDSKSASVLVSGTHLGHSLWCSLGTDPTENTTSHNSSVVAHYQLGVTESIVPRSTHFPYFAWS
jgi:hypothetical protein